MNATGPPKPPVPKKRGGLLKRAGKLSAMAGNLAKRAVTEAYWAFCHESDEHNSRLAVFYFKPDADDDLVIAKVEDTMNRMGVEPGRVTRHRKKP